MHKMSRSKKVVIVEPVPNLWHLSRSHVARFNLLEELRSVRGIEEERHRYQLNTAEPEPIEHGNPLGAPVVGDGRSKPGAMTPKLARVVRPAGGESPSDEASKKRPGFLLIEISNDPTMMPNEHVRRHELLSGAIVEQERLLAASRSEFALLKKDGSGAEWAKSTVQWDRLPSANGTGHSEAQLRYFPRSAVRARDCGVYKEAKACRPTDPTYLHREMMFRQKHMKRA